MGRKNLMSYVSQKSTYRRDGEPKATVVLHGTGIEFELPQSEAPAYNQAVTITIEWNDT